MVTRTEWGEFYSRELWKRFSTHFVMQDGRTGERWHSPVLSRMEDLIGTDNRGFGFASHLRRGKFVANNVAANLQAGGGISIRRENELRVLQRRTQRLFSELHAGSDLFFIGLHQLRRELVAKLMHELNDRAIRRVRLPDVVLSGLQSCAGNLCRRGDGEVACFRPARMS